MAKKPMKKKNARNVESRENCSRERVIEEWRKNRLTIVHVEELYWKLLMFAIAVSKLLADFFFLFSFPINSSFTWQLFEGPFACMFDS